MPVDVSDATESGAGAALGRAAERLLVLLGRTKAELSVSLVDDPRIRKLNREWRGKDRATDVLSFEQDDPAILGDVVLSIDTAQRQADDGGWTLEEELNRLLLHGVLHLLGYEHERGGEEERRMKAEEARLARALVDAGHPCACEPC